jgi:hypothetical protein
VDFQRIEDYELADVFAEVDIDAEDETMLAFHKGTLLSLAAAEPEATSRRTRGTTTRAPRTNRSASRRSASTGTSRPEHRPPARRAAASRRPDWRSVASRCGNPRRAGRRAVGEGAGIDRGHPERPRWAGGAAIAASAERLSLPDERRLQDQGRRSRGLDDLEVFIRQRMEDLSSVLEARVRKRDRWTTIVGIAISVVTGFLVQRAIEIQGWGIWVIVLVAVGLFAGFLLLRDKLF